MISGLFLISQKSEIVLHRFYRDDISRNAAEAFRLQVIAAKETGSQPPIKYIDGLSFLYTRHTNMYFVAVARKSVNAALVFEFLYQLGRIFQAYFGKDFNEDTVRDNFTLIYELLDEMMDFGYPQHCAVDVLKLYINLGTISGNADSTQPTSQLTSQITGAIDWRREGLRYKKNEVYIDVLENVNLLMSATGNILRNEVSGKVVMKTMLSGMPECKFGLNDKLIMDREPTASSAVRKPGRSVEIDDCTFHRCVRLGKFDADRTITFIPPDGEFELMRYRVTDNVNLPFKIIPAIQEEGKTRINVNVKLSASFSDRYFASNVIIKIPAPTNTARCNIHTAFGSCKYEPEHRALIWKIFRFQGGTESMLKAEIELIKGIKDKVWSRPPIQMEFQVPMFTSSGLQVRFLKVFEKSSYQTTKWVRYITRAGQYQIRI